MMPREWDNEVRKPWNSSIHHILKAIDTHTQLYLTTGDQWHRTQADFLRKYVGDLKTRIQLEEKNKNL